MTTALQLPAGLADAWPFDPLVWIGIVAGAALYARGLTRLWSTPAGRRAVQAWRAWCFAGALVLAAVALLTPVDVAAESLVAAHMAQHLLLTIGVAPLLVLGRPVLVSSFALPDRWQQPALRLRLPATTRHPVGVAAAAATVHVLATWIWHVPALYRAALRSDVLHAVEHLSLLAGGAALWWLVADARGRHAGAPAVLAVLATVFAGSALAGAMTFSGQPFYADAVGGGPASWGLTALEDQQLAGGLLWFPGSLAYVVAGATVFLRWLHQDELAAALHGPVTPVAAAATTSSPVASPTTAPRREAS